MGVAIVRVPGGFDFSEILQDDDDNATNPAAASANRNFKIPITLILRLIFIILVC